jgi:co-chaperonin GroES (HSP10)
MVNSQIEIKVGDKLIIKKWEDTAI